MCCNLLGISLGNTAIFLDLKKKTSAFLYSFTSVRDTTFSRTFQEENIDYRVTVHFDKIAQRDIPHHTSAEVYCPNCQKDSSAGRYGNIRVIVGLNIAVIKALLFSLPVFWLEK